jgi:hypothetical protein
MKLATLSMCKAILWLNSYVSHKEKYVKLQQKVQDDVVVI